MSVSQALNGGIQKWRSRAATVLQEADEERGREGDNVDGWDEQSRMLASLGRHMFQGKYLPSYLSPSAYRSIL